MLNLYESTMVERIIEDDDIQFKLLDFGFDVTNLHLINRDRIFNSAERKRYNMYYLKNYSLLLDLEIVLKALFNL